MSMRRVGRGGIGPAPPATMLATSREPIGVSGEATFRVPSLSLADDAIELFADRARLAQSDFAVTADNAATVNEICRPPGRHAAGDRAAAARVRALSRRRSSTAARPVPLADRRFAHRGAPPADPARLGGVVACAADRTRAHTVPRLAVFLGGFDLDAAEAVAGVREVERYQVLDQLSLLVDKSLVVAESIGGATRTGSWRPCANTRRRSSVNPARPTRCGPGTGTTTQRWLAAGRSCAVP